MLEKGWMVLKNRFSLTTSVGFQWDLSSFEERQVRLRKRVSLSGDPRGEAAVSLWLLSDGSICALTSVQLEKW